jgi:hypothetical protein
MPLLYLSVNLRKVCNYIQQRSQKYFQCIMFYERSQSLVGICKDVGTISSRTMTLDLTLDKSEEEKKGKKRGNLQAASEGGPRKQQALPASPTMVPTW